MPGVDPRSFLPSAYSCLIIAGANPYPIIAGADPHEGDLDSTVSVSNTLAFRRMMESYANWLLGGLEKAK